MARWSYSLSDEYAHNNRGTVWQCFQFGLSWNYIGRANRARTTLEPKITALAKASSHLAVRPLLSSKRRPHFKHRGLERTKIWLFVLKPRLTVLAKSSSNLPNWPTGPLLAVSHQDHGLLSMETADRIPAVGSHYQAMEIWRLMEGLGKCCCYS